MLLGRIALLLRCIALQHFPCSAMILGRLEYRVAAIVRYRSDKADKARQTSLRRVYAAVIGIASYADLWYAGWVD